MKNTIHNEKYHTFNIFFLQKLWWREKKRGKKDKRGGKGDKRGKKWIRGRIMTKSATLGEKDIFSQNLYGTYFGEKYYFGRGGGSIWFLGNICIYPFLYTYEVTKYLLTLWCLQFNEEWFFVKKKLMSTISLCFRIKILYVQMLKEMVSGDWMQQVLVSHKKNSVILM